MLQRPVLRNSARNSSGQHSLAVRLGGNWLCDCGYYISLSVLPAIVLLFSTFNAFACDCPNGFPKDPSFFPIGVWLQSPTRAMSYKAIGINTYVGLWDGPTENQL